MIGPTTLLVAAVLTAQATPAPAPGTLDSLNLSCSDFERNSDGSWSPAHALMVGAMTVSAAASFRAGDIVGGRNGVDLGTMLDKECKPKS